MKKLNVFLETMSSYLVKYAPVTKGLSENTIRSYSSAFQLLFQYIELEKGIRPENVGFDTFDKEMFEDFLIWLEKSRGCSISTRNQRLRGLSSFASYALGKNSVEAATFYNAITTIPTKRSEKPTPIYFTKDETGIILHLPPGNGKIACRDRTMMSVLYASGSRAQELCDIRVRDIRFGEKTSIKLIGKGSKARRITIPEQCSVLLKEHLVLTNKLSFSDKHVFSSQTHEHMTISCVEEIVKKYVRRAKVENPTLFKEKKYTPHSFRHSIAVHMLEAEIPLPVIKNFLGHSSIEATMIYATVSDELKNKYLRENSITSCIPRKDEDDATSLKKYPGLDFLNKFSQK